MLLNSIIIELSNSLGLEENNFIKLPLFSAFNEMVSNFFKMCIFFPFYPPFSLFLGYLKKKVNLELSV